MVLRRNSRQEAAPAPAAATVATSPTASSTRYRMVEKLVSIGDDFAIENAQGQRVFFIDGKALRLRNTLIFRDSQGQEVCRKQERIARVRDSMEIEDPAGNRLAMVHKAMVTPVRERYTVKIGDGPDLAVQGNILNHEYRIGDVATVSRKWFRIRDSYGVEIAPGQNDALILAVTVVIDQLRESVR